MHKEVVREISPLRAATTCRGGRYQDVLRVEWCDDGRCRKEHTGYYRIQGPHLVIEFAPQRDDPGLHVHAIYRDPANDYGRARKTQ